MRRGKAKAAAQARGHRRHFPHVHFPLAVEEAAIGHIEAGNRVLALPSFVATYQQRA